MPDCEPGDFTLATMPVRVQKLGRFSRSRTPRQTRLRPSTSSCRRHRRRQDVTGVEEATATDTVLAAYDSGIRYYDTAPFYGHGKSEVRLGGILAQYPRDDFVLSTKVGRVLVPAEGGAIEDHAYRDTLDYNPVFDLSADGIRRSFESSLERLGLDRIDIALLHDPDDHFDEAIAQAFPTLLRMREEGLVTAIGAGMNQSEMLYEFARRIDVDCFLLAGRYTLLDQSASELLLPECENRGISIILGGPYNSGILAGGEHLRGGAHRDRREKETPRRALRGPRCAAEGRGTTVPAETPRRGLRSRRGAHRGGSQRKCRHDGHRYPGQLLGCAHRGARARSRSLAGERRRAFHTPCVSVAPSHAPNFLGCNKSPPPTHRHSPAQPLHPSFHLPP